MKKIQAEKVKLTRDGKIKRGKLQIITPEKELLSKLPSGWILCTLEELCQLKSGTTIDPIFERKIGDIKYIKVRSMNISGNQLFITTSDRFLNIEDINKSNLIPANSIIFPKRGGAISTNKKRIVLEPILADLNIMAIICPDILNLYYIYIWFSTINLWKLNTGTSVPQINNKDISPLQVPLPPLNEQKRIVARVESLLAKVDELVKANEKAGIQRKEAGKSLLHYLSQAQSRQETVKYWQIIENHFEDVFTDLENIRELRKTCLQLAVQGKLVPQDPNDEPATVLLEKIRIEKEKLIKEGKIKREKPLPPVSEKEMPYELTEGWVWCRLEEVALIEMGQSPSGDTYNTSKYGVPLINGPVEFSASPFGYTIINQYTTKPTKICNRGDLLICVRGATTGRTNIASCDACIGRGVALLRPYISIKYFGQFIIHSRYNILLKGKGTTFPSVSKEELRSMLFPLPPLPEQTRIVEKVDKLMAICDRLEERVRKTEELVEGMMGGLMKHHSE